MLYLSFVIAYMAKEIGREIKCAVDGQEDSPLDTEYFVTFVR